MLPWAGGALLLLAAHDALARVGGGESFSGGGSSSGGGGGGDDGAAELVFYILRFLIWLTLEYPAIGIPVDIIVLILVIRWWLKKNSNTVVTISTSAPVTAPRRLDALRRFDPNFSEITFSDFCYSLYARAHHARGAGDLERYAPYLSEGARNALRGRARAGLREVRGVVIGSFRVVDVRGLDGPQVIVMVAFEANYTEVFAEGEQSWYVREQWMLERSRDILSPPPEKAKADHCPRCGAALQTRTDGSCEYCGVQIRNGSFHWYVRLITLGTRETRGPLLTSNVPEQGTSRPTIRQPHLPAIPHWEEFESRVRRIAAELQDAWTARDWERVRPLETDSLFQTHRYWIDAYRRQNLRNVVDDYRITRIEPVKVDSDAFYESITVRTWAEGRDYTVDANGNVVAGSKTQLRRWSEYWTFIRTLGGASGSPKSCPNCGANVAVGATGVCEFCGGKLTAGEFDWVLSRIEQDDVYAG
ncbi:MAG TPA: TIM44-like domain-containing protein [Thermoanaerobaculia bacterium]|nr:TIM44-like domain-containing protein [Thermoanaerobaculia bacterium]